MLDLSGRICLGEGSLTLRDFFKKIVAEGNRKIVLNVADVTYIDSSGLHELAHAYMAVRNQGGQVKLLNLTGKVQDLLQVTKLGRVFDLYSDERKAVESFREPGCIATVHCAVLLAVRPF